MKILFRQTGFIIAVGLTVLLLSTSLLAQENSSDKSWNNAQAEMKAIFGQVPVEFTHMPNYMRSATWEWFKEMSNPKAAIPLKYRELIGLGVAAQIPCELCTYVHTKQAKMYGATDEEIKEAVAEAALTRYMSTIAYGNQQDFKTFKAQWNEILKYIVAHNKSKLSTHESSDQSWETAQSEMKKMFGQVPFEFEHMPNYMRGNTWQWFKSINNPKAAIPPKYAELIGLAVAAQIPCRYCIYIHTKQAKMHGATEEEIKEAVNEAGFTRFMSTIENGNQRDYEGFKANWDKMLKYVHEHNKSK